jgi:SAM-dependent methyltransferase
MTQTTLSLDEQDADPIAHPAEAVRPSRVAAGNAADAQATTAQNAAWFDENDLYIATQSKLEHYQHVKRCVEHEIRGVNRLLDVGNGGFFNYDTQMVGHATAVDLFLRDGPGPQPNTSFKAGSLLDLPFDDESFDAILLQNVFHHITGRSVADNHANLRRSMAELHRCVARGGKVIVVESTVNPVFYLFERAVYRLFLTIKRGGHPVTFQFTPSQLIREAELSGMEVAEYTFVPRGMWILQFGHKWPSFLTPARAVKLVLKR